MFIAKKLLKVKKKQSGVSFCDSDWIFLQSWEFRIKFITHICLSVIGGKVFVKKFLSCCFFSLILFSTNGFAQTSPAEIEQALLNEINTARTNPKVYINYLEEHKKLFKGKNVDYPDVMMLTFEGTAAVDEAIKYLKGVSKLEPLSFSSGLSKPAKIQLNDLMENYSLAHTGKDGSNLPKRIARFGKGGKLYSENIMNQFSNPKDIVMLMIIDDGIKNRGHRKNIFSKTFMQLGIAFGTGKNNDPISVFVFADNFVENKN